MRARLVSLLFVALVFGCGDDDGPTSTPESDAGTETDSGTTGGCASDDDCRRFSSTCDGCDCLPLLESDPDPVCEGMMVSCLIDPCETAGAVTCDVATGTCELE